MKKLKRVVCGLFAIVMSVMMVLSVDCQKVSAAGKVYVNSDVRCGVGMKYYSGVRVTLAGENDRIKNVKVYQGKKKTTNLVVKVTSQRKGEYAYLTMYAKKAGTYKVTFDVYKDSKTKRTSRTIKVHAQGYNTVIKSVQLNGKNIVEDANSAYSTYISNKSAKVKFGLADGYKIKKITVSSYDQNGEEKTKSFKNGKNVTFGKYGYTYDSDYYWEKGMWAYTKFTITYVDKYAQSVDNNESTVTYYIYTRATKWY